MQYLITFVEGIASFISPCILPVIPIYVSYFGNESKGLKKSVINSIGFVSGFSVIFIILGIFSSSFGKLVHGYSDYINLVLGIFLIIMGLNYIGIIFIKFLNKTKGITVTQKDLTILSAAIFGMLFSLSWTPCVGAFLSSALIMASTTGSILKGAFLLLCYSLGLAIPFIVTTIFLEKMKTTFDFIKKNYTIINKISGSILLFYGVCNVVKAIIGIIH